jgi:hypothetical protein
LQFDLPSLFLPRDGWLGGDLCDGDSEQGWK